MPIEARQNSNLFRTKHCYVVHTDRVLQREWISLRAVFDGQIVVPLLHTAEEAADALRASPALALDASVIDAAAAAAVAHGPTGARQLLDRAMQACAAAACDAQGAQQGAQDAQDASRGSEAAGASPIAQLEALEELMLYDML